MLNYWYVNNLVRPVNRPLPRNCLPQPWVGRAIAQQKRDNMVDPDDVDLTQYQTWEQHLEHHFRDQALLIHEQELAFDDEEALQADLDDYLTSFEAHVALYSSPPYDGNLDTEDEEYVLRVEHEFRQFRALPVGPGISQLPEFSHGLHTFLGNGPFGLEAPYSHVLYSTSESPSSGERAVFDIIRHSPLPGKLSIPHG